MKKLQKIIAIALTCLTIGSTFSIAGCKDSKAGCKDSKYNCTTCQDEGIIDCSCGGGYCYSCQGRGRDDSRKCDICKGKGRLWDGKDFDTLEDCWRCNGFGTYVCLYCDGDGQLEYCQKCNHGRRDCPDCAKN